MSIPESEVDLWSDAAILDPYPGYRELRDTAAAVWLAKYGLFALSRYADVRDAIQHWHPFSSASGVMMNDHINEALRGIMLCSDPPVHDVLRGVARRPMMPRELKSLEALISEEAERLVSLSPSGASTPPPNWRSTCRSPSCPGSSASRKKAASRCSTGRGRISTASGR